MSEQIASAEIAREDTLGDALMEAGVAEAETDLPSVTYEPDTADAVALADSENADDTIDDTACFCSYAMG